MTNTNKILSYKDLVVWQKAMDLVVLIYRLTEKFPKEEMYGLTSQMRRAAISIPSNIAEGKCRGTRKDYRHFLLASFGSSAELETQIEIAKRLNFISLSGCINIDTLLIEISKMLNSIINKLESDSALKPNT